LIVRGLTLIDFDPAGSGIERITDHEHQITGMSLALRVIERRDQPDAAGTRGNGCAFSGEGDVGRAFERFPPTGDPPPLTISADDRVFATYPCLTEDENAFFCTAVLERLDADGRLGAFWWCWAEHPDDVRASPPFAGTPYECSFCIIRADGSEKPVAAALAAFARQQRDVAVAHDMPMIASAYYYRTLPTSMRTVYEAFLPFVAPAAYRRGLSRRSARTGSRSISR